MSNQTYGVGIVGLGVIAQFHAQALAELPNVKLIAGCDVVPESGQAFAKEFSCDYIPDYNKFCSCDDMGIGV